MVIEFKGRLGTLDAWDARGTLGGRCSKERGREGDGRSRSRYKNLSITVIFSLRLSYPKFLAILYNYIKYIFKIVTTGHACHILKKFI